MDFVADNEDCNFIQTFSIYDSLLYYLKRVIFLAKAMSLPNKYECIWMPGLEMLQFGANFSMTDLSSVLCPEL